MSLSSLPPLVTSNRPPAIENMRQDSDVDSVASSPVDTRAPSPSDGMNTTEKLHYLTKLLQEQQLDCLSTLSYFTITAIDAHLAEREAYKNKKWASCILHGLAFRVYHTVDDLICGGARPVFCLSECIPSIFSCPCITCYHGLGALFHKIYKKDTKCASAKDGFKAVFEGLNACGNYSMICATEGMMSCACIGRSILCPEICIDTEVNVRIGFENDLKKITSRWIESQEEVFPWCSSD